MSKKNLNLQIKRRNRPTWYYPQSAERYYTKALLELSLNLRNLIKKDLMPHIQSMIDEVSIKDPSPLSNGFVIKSDSAILTLNGILGFIKRAILPSEKKAKESAVKTSFMVIDQNESQFKKLMKHTLGVDIFFNDPWLVDQTELFADQNSKLITNMVDEELLRVSGYVERGLQEGSRFTEIAKEIKNSFGITDRKAKLIARDQTSKINASITRLRQEELGIESYEWSTSKDERVRSTHKANEGKVFKWSEPPKITGHPSHDVNCFPGNLDFFSNHVVNKLFRHFYTGELSEIVTDNGFIFKATPNHPILTNKGWIAVKDIEIGDYVFETLDKRFQTSEMNIENTESSFKDSFDTIQEFFGFFKSSSGGNFHGDISNNEIDIISFDCELIKEWDISALKEFNEFLLALSCCNLQSDLSIFSRLNAAFQRIGISSPRLVSIFSKLFLFLNGHFCHSDEVSFRFISNKYSIFNKPLLNRFSGNIISLAQFKDANSLVIQDYHFINRQLLKIMRLLTSHCFSDNQSSFFKMSAESIGKNIVSSSEFVQTNSLNIQRHKVINKFVSEFSGHVYNLETDSSYYNIKNNCQNLVAHNCRCVALPYLDYLLLMDATHVR